MFSGGSGVGSPTGAAAPSINTSTSSLPGGVPVTTPERSAASHTARTYYGYRNQAERARAAGDATGALLASRRALVQLDPINDAAAAFNLRQTALRDSRNHHDTVEVPRLMRGPFPGKCTVEGSNVADSPLGSVGAATRTAIDYLNNTKKSSWLGDALGEAVDLFAAAPASPSTPTPQQRSSGGAAFAGGPIGAAPFAGVNVKVEPGVEGVASFVPQPRVKVEVVDVDGDDTPQQKAQRMEVPGATATTSNSMSAANSVGRGRQLHTPKVASPTIGHPGPQESHATTSPVMNQQQQPEANNKPIHPFFSKYGKQPPAAPGQGPQGGPPSVQPPPTLQPPPQQQPPPAPEPPQQPAQPRFGPPTTTTSATGPSGGYPATFNTSGGAPPPPNSYGTPNNNPYGNNRNRQPRETPPSMANRHYPPPPGTTDPNAPPADGLEAHGQVTGFLSAAQQLEKDVKSGRVRPNFAGGGNNNSAGSSGSGGAAPRRLGLGRQQPFVPPLARNDDPQQAGPGGAPGGAVPPADSNGGGGAPNQQGGVGIERVLRAVGGGHNNNNNTNNGKAPPSGNQQGNKDGDDDDEGVIPSILLNPDGSVPAKLDGLEPKLLQQVAGEILEGSGNEVGWEDIAGLEHAKESVEEAIVWPLKRPDLFVGLRDPPRGLLLFGPPGTGKTMIARAIASRANCTFLNISSSSLMSKWVGEGEKLVRCLFAVATVKQPSVIFIDEVDSLLSMRSEGEMDAIRRVKTEFLVHLDGVGTSASDRVLVIGATNRPEELDEAARRRMEKRLYIPLPDHGARSQLFSHVLRKTKHSITEPDLVRLANATDGYSCADIMMVARDAAMGPLRDKGMNISTVNVDDLRPVTVRDFHQATKRVKSSVGKGELERHEAWNAEYGSFNEEEGDGEDGGLAGGDEDDDADFDQFGMEPGNVAN